MKSYLSARLAKYKALNGVCFVGDIPRTPSGKAQKYKLRDLYAALAVSKKRKRKSDVSETIGKRDAEVGNGVVVPAEMNGALDSGAVQKAVGGQSDLGDAKSNGSNGGPVHEPQSTRKRVKIEVDVDYGGTLIEGESATIIGGTLMPATNGHVVSDDAEPGGANGRPVNEPKPRRKRLKVEVEVEIEYDGALSEGDRGIVTGGTLVHSDIAKTPVNGVH